MKIEDCFSALRQAHSVLPPKSLVRSSLEIGRVLADRDGVTFRAQGTCMYPTVRPDDVLTIQSRTVANIAIGDIAVCRTQDYLFSHRVIKKGDIEGKPYIVTRSDRVSEGSDAPIFDDNLLGIVVAIKRNGKSVPLLPSEYPWIVRHYYEKKLAFIERKELLKLRLSSCLTHRDAPLFYKIITKTIFKLAHPRLTYVVKVPLNETLGHAVFRKLTLDDFDPEELWNNRKIIRWTIELYLNDNIEPGAWITLIRNPNENWSVAESHIRFRYRGTGLEQLLFSKAQNILKEKIK